jgi:hypothetical protein
MKQVFVFACLALLVVGGTAFGQGTKGSITVSVTDDSGAGIPGATVEASSDQALRSATAVTGADGAATLSGLDPASNYVVTTTMDGFNGARNENVLVRSGQTTGIRVTLTLATVTEEVLVTAESPVVDITSAQTGQEITLDLVESLPTARTYQDYLQLVPGVQAAVVDANGNNNPASRSGTNYQDILGTVGDSRDNFYYFEGINVTDSVSGVAGAFINTEIIQQQNVTTGGLLNAEFIGATGLVSSVVTKSGGNDFSGSVNYYLQNDSLVESNKNRADDSFSTYDTAFTLGGPIVKDKAWFFGSFRLVNREQDVSDPGGNLQRTVTRDDEQAFAKLSFAPTASSLLTGIYLDDPWERDGSFDDQTTNLRDTTVDRGGDRYTATYSLVTGGGLVFDVGYGEHERSVDTLPANLDTRNDVNFRNADLPQPIENEQFGGSGTVFDETRGSETFRGSLEYLADTSWGDHTLKFGYESAEMNDNRDFVTTGDGGIYNSLAAIYAGQGVTAAEVASSFGDVDFNHTNTSDMAGFNQFASPAVFGVLDTNNDGTISSAEAGAIVFDSTAGNPNGFINYDRIFQSSSGAQFTKSEGTTFYGQDTWQSGKWSVNAGVRTEEWEHFSTTGANIYTFPNEVAPRLSVTYDLKGDGKQRLSAYYGRYYDPIRNNMTNFAGSVTGRERREQVFITTDPATGAGEWTTYRIRGGPSQPDANFAPTTETPFTDEWQVGYKRDLGRNQSVEVNLIKRETRDILEDYDLPLYGGLAPRPGGYALPPNDPDSLFLGLDYFGFSDFPNANFFIATLEGGLRDWEGIEVVYRKRMSNNWQMLASYNYADGTGNTNSDSNADFQGDVLWLDPEAINQAGTQPGLVEHLFKVAGTYQWDNGVSAGGTYRWNSGAIVSRTFRASGRNLPLLDVNDPDYTGEPILFAGGDGFNEAGVPGGWLSPLSVGKFDNPSYGTFDARVAYLWNLSGRYEVDFFLDVFNVLDDQASIRNQDLVSGLGGVDFGEGLDFVEPRRYFIGARLRF